MIWQHGRKNLTKFLEALNSCHPTIKFKAECISADKVNFLDVDVILNQLTTDLCVKSTDNRQYLHASFCHVFHSKKSIRYSQALWLNQISSEGRYFDNRCNELESWVLKRGYNAKLVRYQILRDRKFKRDELLHRGPKETVVPKLVFNITYHPAFFKIKNVLSKVHLLLTPNKEHRSVFPEVPIVGFKRCKSLKDTLVRKRLPVIIKEFGESKNCGRKRYGVCEFVNNSSTFTDKNGQATYKGQG